MTANKSGIALAICTVIAGAALVACGGSGSSSSTTAATADNVYLSRVGTYSSGCVDETYYSNGVATSALRSSVMTLTVSNPSGSNQATATVQTSSFTGSSSCDEATKEFYRTVVGTLTALPGTKTITPEQTAALGDPNSLSGTAQTATFTLTQVPVANFVFDVPNVGTSTKVGYMIQDGKFYALIGVREADELGAYFSQKALTKQ